MNILEEIIAHKKKEIECAKEKVPLEKLKKSIAQNNLKKRDFFQAIKEKISKRQIALIAEIKKASPSKGLIKKDFNPVEIARSYKAGGATCLSVLTDEKYFQGNLKFIKDIKETVDLPVLRKDFIVDSYQIYESVYNGADCILLIVGACHGMPLLRDLYNISLENNLDCLIEVHDEKEMEIALNVAGMSMIGINNRDLKTFETNLNTTKNLVNKYKKDLKNKIIISESGIFTNIDIQELNKYDVYGFLVGESLMNSQSIEEATRRLITI